MKKILYFISFVLFTILILNNCKKELSCEDCITTEQPDTTTNTPPPIIVLNKLIFYCNLTIENSTQLKKLYAEVKTKKWPGSYIIFDSVLLNQNDRPFHYLDTFDITKAIDMTPYKKGDIFYGRVELRWKFKPAEFTKDTILVY